MAAGMPFVLPAAAQQSSHTIRGVVRDSASGAPVAGVVVIARDADGASLARGLTSPAGRYSVVTTGQVQRLQLTRIGYRAREARVSAPENGVSVVDVEMTALATMLEPVRTTASGRCPARPDAAAAFALLDQGRAGLLTAVVGRETDSAMVSVVAFDRTMDGNSDRIDRQRVRLRTVERAKTSFNATRTAADFVQRGFVQDDNGKQTFFGPDAEVMLDESFTRGYCFRLARASASDTARANQVGLAFAPLERRRGRIDIEGTLWVDTIARRLGSVEFRYVGLDNVTTGFNPGGRVSFREVMPGAVMIDGWSMRIVGAADSATRQGYSVHEIGGELAEARWPDGRTWTASLGKARIKATNADGTPTPNAMVTLDSTDYSAATDSTGVAEFRNLVSGPYTVAVAEPRLVEMGLPLVTPVSFSADRDRTLDVDVRTPNADEYGATVCRADGRANATTWILGRAASLDGQPIANVQWKLSRLVAGTWRPFATGGVTGTSGLFHFCTSLPKGESIQITAWSEGRQASPETILRRVTGPLVTFPVRVHGAIAARNAPSRPASVLRGVVLDSTSGRAVGGAHVGLLGTSPPLQDVTDSAGQFIIRGLVPGEYTAQVRTWALDSLDVTSQSTILFMDSTKLVRLYVPTTGEIAKSMCSAPGMNTNTGIIVGTVNASDATSTENATVLAVWKEATGAASVPEHWLQTRTDARGMFRLCGAPLNTAVAVHAALDSAGSRPMDVRIPADGGFVRADLTLSRQVDGRAILSRVGLQPGATRTVADERTRAKRRELVGFVRDPQGGGIENVTIEIPNATTRTDAAGAFRMWTADADTLPMLVRRLGFSPVTALLTAHDQQWDTVVVELGPAPQVLAGVKVEATRGRSSTFRGLIDRQRQAFGVYLTRQEIEARGTSRLSDLLRTKRGIAIVSARGHAALRFTRYADKSGQSWGNLGGGFALPPPARTPGQPVQQESMATPLADCKPAVWLDGVNMLDMEIDDLLAMDVEAVELYETQTGLPLEFVPTSRDRFCGVVVIWTRVQ
jgi:hypothetical protein